MSFRSSFHPLRLKTLTASATVFADLIGHDKPGADWKYVGSKVNEVTGSQRTETYITTGIGTTKLRHGSVYLDSDVVKIVRWRTTPDVQAPDHSPFKRT